MVMPLLVKRHELISAGNECGVVAEIPTTSVIICMAVEVSLSVTVGVISELFLKIWANVQTGALLIAKTTTVHTAKKTAVGVQHLNKTATEEMPVW